MILIRFFFLSFSGMAAICFHNVTLHTRVFTLCFSKHHNHTKKERKNMFISILPSIWKQFSNQLFLVHGRTARHTFLLFIPKLKNKKCRCGTVGSGNVMKKKYVHPAGQEMKGSGNDFPNLSMPSFMRTF